MCLKLYQVTMDTNIGDGMYRLISQQATEPSCQLTIRTLRFDSEYKFDYEYDLI